MEFTRIGLSDVAAIPRLFIPADYDPPVRTQILIGPAVNFEILREARYFHQRHQIMGKGVGGKLLVGEVMTSSPFGNTSLQGALHRLPHQVVRARIPARHEQRPGFLIPDPRECLKVLTIDGHISIIRWIMREENLARR